MKPFYVFFAGVILLIVLTALLSCNRKLHTEKTETHEVNDQSHIVDSLTKVVKTWSDAYEELLKTTNSTGVVFESIPCDTSKNETANIPHVIIKPDGTKEFSGPIKSYKDDQSTYKKIADVRKFVIDSMNRLQKKDTSHHEASSVVVLKTVKTTYIPLWIWIILIVAGLLWLNERFRFVTIPFLTKK